MSEWLDNQKKQSSNFRNLLQERIKKANPRRKLSAEEIKRLNKLESIADKLKRGENVQNRQLQTWLREDEYEQLEYEWQEQLELRSELKDKPSNEKRYYEKSLHTKRRAESIDKAEEIYFDLQNELKDGRKLFSVSIAVSRKIKVAVDAINSAVNGVFQS